jgi:AmmeMemoRadiSam system protein B
MRIPPPAIDRLLLALDQAYLLDNGTYLRAQEHALTEYRTAPFRPATSAGQSYPEDPQELKRLLDGYLNQIGTSPDQPPAASPAIRGLVSPHIDYARGGSIYAQVWSRAAQAARKADLALILGTDHYGGEATVTLTRQNYATPYGALPTAGDVVDNLAQAVGKETAFAQELHHRTEHSVELAAVWLHHMRGGEPCEIVPVLCGSFRNCIQGGADTAPDRLIDAPFDGALVDAFHRATAGRRVLVVAAADLAHVGPVFGGRPADIVGRARLQAADQAIIDHITAGDAEGFLEDIRRVEDRNNVCGVPPIYLALRLLQPVRGELVAYDRCPADRQGTSLVTICGIVFS